MTARIPVPKELIASFCHRNHIQCLTLFGFVLCTDFRPDSDIDVLVEFESGTCPDYLASRAWSANSPGYSMATASICVRWEI